MGRIEEKVKDLIDVRKHEQLFDFLAEPEKTIDAYFYTAVTADLMVSWLNSVSYAEKGNGICKALAGYRGVGKSHFLATFGGMLEHPELRAKVDDSHVFASLHHLKRRHYPVAYVRRGTKPTFEEELYFAVCKALGIPVNPSPVDIEAVVKQAAESAKDLPFIILVDTDLEREMRVARDDGNPLGELARIAKQHNVFVGIALDDDITDADGVNAAIADAYEISYLDQEHLYTIVDTQVFPKHRQSAPLIQNLYKEFRDTLPNFRWSEQRFNSLYPLHPSILEVAPFVRFYAPTFALLGFASKAGERILGRPANSLISLDEVFDSVESTLRKSPDLIDSFETYDRVLSQVIAQIPVMQRLQSKLVLKALFVLSLDGNGSTAEEICEAMLIFDELDPKKSIADIELLLLNFSKGVEGVWRREEAGRETRFGISIAVKDDLNSALNAAILQVGADAPERVLRRLARDKFGDWMETAADSPAESNTIKAQFIWNGSYRSAEIDWNFASQATFRPAANSVDARLSIFSKRSSLPEYFDPNIADAVWVAADLTDEENETLRRLFVLLHDTSLKNQFGEQVRAAGHTHLVAAEKIWNRIFYKESRFFINGIECPIGPETRLDGTFSEILEDLFSKYFTKQFPGHPEFEGVLDMVQVGRLVSDLFSGVRVANPVIQESAKRFAMPLGLVREREGEIVLASEDSIESLSYLNNLFVEIADASEGVISLDAVYGMLKAAPYGLSKEAQYLVLAALVALRKIEFVTTRGDRISHRSLDLRIIWDDIVGIARPADVQIDYELLNQWARAVLRTDEIVEFGETQGREEVISALQQWRQDWIQRGVLERFAELPDEMLNRKIWGLSVTVEKSFGVVSRILNSVADDPCVLEDALQRVAETFSNSLSEIDVRYLDLALFEHYIESTSKRQRIWSYLAVCETTQDESIEKYRRNLLNMIERSYDLSAFETCEEIDELWQGFRERFIEYFCLRHNAIMNSQQIKNEFERILKSDEWWEFECLSKLPIFKMNHWKKAQRILRRFRELECGFDVKANLISHPFCACSFSLTSINELAKLSGALASTIEVGRRSYRKTLRTIQSFIEQQVKTTFSNDADLAILEEAQSLVSQLKSLRSEPLSSGQLSVLYSTLINDTVSTSVNIEFPKESGLYTSDELRARLNAWIDDLPDEPIMLKLV